MQDLTLLLSFLCFRHQPDPTRPSRDWQILPSACGILEPAGKLALPSLCLSPEGSRAAQAGVGTARCPLLLSQPVGLEGHQWLSAWHSQILTSLTPGCSSSRGKFPL